MDQATLTLQVLAAVGVLLVGLGWLAHKLRLPPALGYLAAGLLASYLVASHRIPNDLLPTGLLGPAAQVGVLFLLFLIGLELDLKRLRETLSTTAVALPFDILVPALVLGTAVRLAGWSLIQSVAFGLVLSVSSTIFGERLASDPRFPMEARKRALGILLSEDVAAAGLLAVLAVIAGGAGWLGPVTDMGRLVFLFVLITAAALLLVPRLLDLVARNHSHELLVVLGGALVVAFGAVGQWAGSMQLGALMAGVAAAEAGSRFVIRNALQSLRDLAVALFFFTSGLQVDAGQILTHFPLVVAVALLFLLSKLIVHLPMALASGLRFDDSLRTALALSTVGEFSLILAATALARGLAHPLLETATVGAMLVLLVLAPLLQLSVPSLSRAAALIPTPILKRLQYLVRGVRRDAGSPPDVLRVGSAVRLLAANLVLFLAWIILAATVAPRLVQQADPKGPIGATIALGIAAAGAAPLLVNLFRRYRDVVWLLAGLTPGENSARMRPRLIDTWVVITATLLLTPIGLLLPGDPRVLASGAFLAIGLAAVSWRALSRFHRAVEGTVIRVLGHDAETGALLDREMEEYPWGVRFSAISVPPGSPVANQTVKGARINALTGATIAVLQRNRRETVNPGPDELLHVGDTLVVMGDTHQIARAEALIVAHGEALRLTAQSRTANVVEVSVKAGSSLAGQLLGLTAMRERTGTLVIGIWPAGRSHPLPYRTDHSLRIGDRLILLGSPGHIARAKLLAEGQEDESTVESRSDEPEPQG